MRELVVRVRMSMMAFVTTVSIVHNTMIVGVGPIARIAAYDADCFRRLPYHLHNQGVSAKIPVLATMRPRQSLLQMVYATTA